MTIYWKNTEIKDLNEEIWKPFPDYELLYLASNLGRIKSLGRISLRGHLLKPRILKQELNCNGYSIVSLWKEGKQRTFTVHKMVIDSFIPKSIEKKCVNHINGIKYDNRLINLERVTHSENNLHAYSILGRTKGMKEKFGLLRKDSRKVNQYSLKGELINTYKSIQLAEMATKIQRTNIRKCINRQRNMAGGFIWKWA